MSVQEDIRAARERGKDITDFLTPLQTFMEQYYLYKFRQFTWQMMWTSNQFEKWKEIDAEWLKVRPRITDELDFMWNDAQTLSPNTDPDIVADYVEQNAYIHTAYLELQHWLQENTQ